MLRGEAPGSHDRLLDFYLFEIILAAFQVTVPFYIPTSHACRGGQVATFGSQFSPMWALG